MNNLDNGNHSSSGNNDQHQLIVNPRHAVLFAEYGNEPEYVRKIVNKLNERNIVVDNIFSPTVRKGIDQAIANADMILLMHEMSGHRDGLFIKETANKLGKNVVFLPRKVSQWGNLSGQHRTTSEGKTVSVRSVSAVSDDNLEPFLKQYMELAEQNVSHRDMLPKLRMFWEGPLGTPQQLGVMLHFLLRSPERCPQWFSAWWLQHRGTLPEAPKPRETVVATPVEENGSGAVANENGGSIEVVDEEEKEEIADEEERVLAEMYAKDAERLNKSLDSAKEKMANIIYILLQEKGIPLTEIENMAKNVYREDRSQNLFAFSLELANKIVGTD